MLAKPLHDRRLAAVSQPKVGVRLSREAQCRADVGRRDLERIVAAGSLTLFQPCPDHVRPRPVGVGRLEGHHVHHHDATEPAEQVQRAGRREVDQR